MFYRQKLKNRAKKDFSITYSTFDSGINTEKDENLLPHKKARICFGYSTKNGALKTGYGFKLLTLPSSSEVNASERSLYWPTDVAFKRVWHFKFWSQTYNQKHHLLVFYYDTPGTGSSGQIGYCQLLNASRYTYQMSQDLTFSKVPNALSYRDDGYDVMIFTSSADTMTVFSPETNLKTVPTAPKIVSMCLHFERLFAIEEGERNKLRFSDDLDITNWTTSLTEGGYIEMVDERGPMQKVLSFENYVYVIRDFGIARVSGYGDQSDFSVAQVYSSSGKIYGNSAEVCGDKIVFLAKNGIHAFNGVSASLLSLGLDSLFENVINDNSCSAYFDGKYFLACRMNFQDDETIGCESFENGYTNNALLSLDMKTGDVDILRGVDISNLASIEEENVSRLVACFNGEHSDKVGMLTNDGEIFGIPTKKVWASPLSSLGFPGKRKFLKELDIQSENNVSVVFKTENISKTITLSGSAKTQKIHPRLSFETLQIRFETTNSNAHISNPKIVLSVEN